MAAEVNAGGPAANAAKRSVARSIVALYHGVEAAERAEEHFDERFKRREVPTDVPEHRLGADDPVHLPLLLVDAGLATSRSEARRFIDDGAVRLDGEPVAPKVYDLALVDADRASAPARQAAGRAAARLIRRSAPGSG